MTHNARINRAARIHTTYIAGIIMKEMLSPLRFNELLCCPCDLLRIFINKTWNHIEAIFSSLPIIEFCLYKVGI